MPKFTKQEFEDELRTLILADATRIQMVTGDHDLALKYLNLPADADTELDVVDGYLWSQYDIKQHGLYQFMNWLYDYAYYPKAEHITADMNDYIYTGQVFIDALMRENGIVTAPLEYGDETIKGACLAVIQTAYARWGIDIGEVPYFELRHLALLADMSLASVRNATSAKDVDQLKAEKQGKRQMVSLAEAKKWLRGRRGYVATPNLDKTTSSNAVQEIHTTADVGQIITRAKELSGMDNSALQSLTHFSDEDLFTWENGTYEADVQMAVTIAKALDLDEILFPSKAIEAALRRDNRT